MAEAEVDNPPHMHTGVGTTRLGQKEVNQSSMGLGWHAQIGAGLSMKGLGAQESYEGSHGLQ